MGNYNITIQGVGPHHNTDHDGDADKLAKLLVTQLRDSGHLIYHASITFGSQESLHAVVPGATIEEHVHVSRGLQMQIETRAADMYTTYCAAVGGKAFNGDPLPDWVTFANDPAKFKQAQAWRLIAERAYSAL